MERRTFAIVGAGMGGLATALRVAHRGERVIVFEKNGYVGGRNHEINVGGCSFDAGPTLVMMLDPFRKLFADVGERLEDHLSISKCDPSYRVFFADGTRLDATSHVGRMAYLVEQIGGARDAEGFRRLLRDLEELYRATIPNFVRKNYDSPSDFFGATQLGRVVRHRLLGNLAGRIRGYVEDPRLRMLFSFQTLYLGLSPYEAPWVYAVLTHMEYGEGIWYPQGGVAEIGNAIARLAVQRGAEIRLNSEVESIEGRTVVLKSGERIEADAVICNADLPYAERSLLGQSPKERRYSCSAYMMYIDYDGQLPELEHHNVFFGANFHGNLQQIFSDKVLPTDPAFYAAISGRTDPLKCEIGHENLYVLVPCPNLDRVWYVEDGATLNAHVFRRLRQEVGFDQSRIARMKTFTPRDWAGEMNLDRGAAFGLSHDLFQSAYFRPSNKSKTHPGLYFVGASTVPGNGLPMVLISAELVEARLKADGLLY